MRSSRARESLATLRPGPAERRCIQLVDRALVAQPGAPAFGRGARAGAARRGAHRGASRRPARVSRAVPEQAARAGAAVLAGGFAGWTAAELPFYPSALGVRPRARRCRGHRVPCRGSASPSRSRCRCCRSGTSRSGSRCSTRRSPPRWIVLCWREPRGALLFALGPLLAPLAALGLVPLAASGSARRPAPRRAGRCRGARRRVVAGVRGAALPFTGARPPLGLGVAGVDRPARRRRHARAGRRRASRAADRGRWPSPAIAVALPYRAGSRPVGSGRARRGACSPLTVLAVPSCTGASARRRRLADGSRSRWCAPSALHDGPPGVMSSRTHGPQGNRAEDRGAFRGRLRARLPHERAAGRAGAEDREGDGRPPDGLRLARLRPERVHRLSSRPPTASSSRATRTRSSRSSRSTSPSTRSARTTRC